MDDDSKCVVCNSEATHKYEYHPVCNEMTCEYEVQVALDYAEEKK